MPYRLIIIDDKIDIREGLTELVDWKSLGFEVAASLEDGRNALEYIDKSPVDVILTDIKMTFISGLDLAKYIYDNKLDIKVVLISGYKEFELARQAVDYNVKHYLLKPTKLDELNKVFREIRQQLDSEKQEKDRIDKISQRYEELIPYLQQQFFNDLVMGGLRSEGEIKRRIGIAGLDSEILQSKFCLLCLQVGDYNQYLSNNWEYGKDRLYTAIQNFFKSSERKIQYFPLSNKDNMIYILAIAPSEMDIVLLRKQIEAYFQNIKDRIRSILDLNISLEIQNVFSDIFELAMYSKPIVVEKETDGRDIRDILGESEFARLLEQQKLFVSYINAGNIEAVDSLFSNFMDMLGSLDIRLKRNFLIDLFSMLCNKLKDIGINVFKITQGTFGYDRIMELQDTQQMRDWGRSALNDIIQYVSRHRSSSETNVILKAKEYIQANYNKDLSLEDVADHVFLSPVYFSRLFKQQTKETYTDYLIEVRMKKAMELLQDDSKYKTYEISSMLGYKDTKYFYRLFKQYTGYTPTEYRQNSSKR